MLLIYALHKDVPLQFLSYIVVLLMKDMVVSTVVEDSCVLKWKRGYAVRQGRT